MTNTKTNTILGTEIFKDVFLDSLIFHIPHSKINIPEEFIGDFIDENRTIKEMMMLTDFATDKIFDIDNTTKLIFPYSRVFCDVERLPDAEEPMYKVGRGFYYTKTDCGKQLRRLNRLSKDEIFEKYYQKHHKELADIVDKKIKSNTFATIIDCHSYSDVPFETDLDQSENRPDFCLGTDPFHTPLWLTNLLKNKLEELGFSVGINNPYSGTIVPIEHFMKDDGVHSIMIEINRKLYMDEDGFVEDKHVVKLNDIIKSLFM